MVTDKDFGWNRMIEGLDELKDLEVVVGIQSDAGMTDDGSMTMAKLGAVHEFGADILQPPQAVTLYRRKNKNGKFANKGRFVKKKRANTVTTAITGWKRIHIPSRPFMRSAIDNNQNSIVRVARKEVEAIIDGEQDARMAAIGVGLHIEGLIKKNFVVGDFAPLAKSTIKRKGSSRPLIDTGHLRQSIRYVIRRKGEEK